MSNLTEHFDRSNARVRRDRVNAVRRLIDQGGYESDFDMSLVVPSVHDGIMDVGPKLPEGFVCGDWDGLE